jgi:hypothetical protein
MKGLAIANRFTIRDEDRPMTENQQAPGGTVDNVHRQARTSSAWAWCLGVMAVAFLLLAAVATFFSSRPLQISHETTYITGPLMSNGKRIDYFAAIEQAIRPENAATKHNGYRLLVQHLGRHPDTDLKRFRAVCAKLGLDADAIRPDVTFEDPMSFLRAYVASDQFDDTWFDRPDVQRYKMPPEFAPGYQRPPEFVLEARLGRPWSLDDLPMMAPWLDANGPALDVVGRAVRKPVFHIPMVRGSEDQLLLAMLLPEVRSVRSFARSLTARANYRIATGDIDGAIDDIMACKRLGRHIGRGATLVDMLVGIALEGIAHAIGIAGSLEHPPTREQLRRCLEESENLSPEVDLDEKLLFARFMGLDVVQAIAQGADADQVLGRPYASLGDDFSSLRYLLTVAVDWNVVAKRFNEHFDAIVATGAEPPPVALSPRAVISARDRSEQVANALGSLLLPAWGSAREAASRTQCVQRVKHITLAMLIYERDHGTLPPAWTADGGGNPLHSWRVLLLPYLGQQALYDAIRLDEPWDSEHNRQFHDETVAFYRCPSDPAAQPGQTTYSVVVGPDMPFEPGEGKRLADFGPHSDDMILLVERARPVCWMDPAQEITQSAAEHGIHRDGSHSAPARGDGIASHHPGGALFGLRNGAAEFLSQTTDLELFHQMLRGTHEGDYRY